MVVLGITFLRQNDIYPNHNAVISQHLILEYVTKALDVMMISRTPFAHHEFQDQSARLERRVFLLTAYSGLFRHDTIALLLALRYHYRMRKHFCIGWHEQAGASVA